MRLSTARKKPKGSFLFALALILLGVPHATAQTTPSVTLSVPSDAGFAEGEGNTTVTVTATLSAARGDATVIDLSLGGSAKTTDYTVVQLPDITVAAGATVSTANLILRPVDDGFFEGPETVRIGGTATGITVTGVDVGLKDNDKAPSLNLSARWPGQLSEGSSATIRMTVSLVGGGTFEEEESIVLSPVYDTLSSEDIDYGTNSPPWQLTLPAGATSAIMNLSFTVVDDDDPEAIETAALLASVTVRGTTFTDRDSPVFWVVPSDQPLSIRISCNTAAYQNYVGDTLGCVPTIFNGPTSRAYTVTMTFGADLMTPNPVVITVPSGSSGVLTSAKVNVVPRAGSAGKSIYPTVTISPNDMDEIVHDSFIRVLPHADANFQISHYSIQPTTGVSIVGQSAMFIHFSHPRPMELVGTLRMELGLDSGIVSASCDRRRPYCTYNVKSGDYDFDGEIVVPAGAVKFTGWRDIRDPTVTGTVASPLPATSRTHSIGDMVIYGGSHAIDLRVSPQSLQEGVGETGLTIIAQNRSASPSNSDIVIPLKLTDVSTNSADYTVSGPLSVTIPAGQLEGSTTAVRLTPVNDVRRESDVELLRIEANSGSKMTPFVRGANLRILDAAGIVLSVSPTAITENGGARQVTVTGTWGDAADSILATDTVVTLAWAGTAGAGDYARSGGASVTIPANARSGSATVTITPTDDRLLEGDESIEILGSAPGRSVTAAEITLRDDETVPAVSLAVDTDSISEGGGARTVTVTATLDPEVAMANDVTTVTLTLSGTAEQGTDYTRTWSPATPTISIPVNATEGSNSVSLTLTPNDDRTDEGDETIVVQGTATTRARSLVVEVATVTLEDDDERGVNLLPKSVTVTEGEDATYEVWLGSQPTDEVTVSLASTDATVAKTNPVELTFSTSAYSTRQTVTVSSVDDFVANVDGKRSVEIRHTAGGGGYDSVDAVSLPVTVEDNEGKPSLVVDPTAVTIEEADDPATQNISEHQGTYTVKLATEPSADVTVAVTGQASTDVSVDTASLTFTVAKWNDAQTVTVTASQDDDASNDEVTLKHTASGGDYGSVVLDVGVTVEDDDTVGLVVDPAAVTIGEADDPETPAKEHQGTYTVTLATEPSADVTVTVTGQASTDVSVDAATLTFTVAKWNDAQTVTVTAAEDDDASNDEVTLKHTASGGDYGSVVLDVVVTVEDDDTVGLVVDPAAVTIGEADDPETPAKEHQGTYTVKLATEPSADVTVAVTGQASTDVSVDAATLTFTVAKWNDAQTVTVTASQDDDASNDEVTLKHTASGGDYGSVVLDVVVTVEDDDTVGLVVDPAAVTVAEADDPETPAKEHQGTYTVRLATEPSADVTVAVAGQASTDVSVDAATLTFTVAKWNDAQTVTVTASQDDDASNDLVTLKHTASGGDYGSVVLDVVVTVEDDDTAGLVVDPAAVTVGEGADATYTVKLATEPSADVTVAVTGQASTDVSVDTASLTFTVEKWNEAQTVTVTASQDDDASNDEVTLKHTASGGDYGSVELDVVVTVSDDDTAGLVVDPAAVTVGEGADATYTVKLATEPSADVTVAVTGQASTDVSVDEATLTFTVAKWNDAQTVTVTAAEDDDASNDEVTLKHTASGGDYGSVELDVGVTVTDDDSPGLVVAPAAVTVGEGADATYTVKLATEPSADVTVAVAGHAGSDLTLDTESLTFTVAKWNDAQTVTVTASQDDDASNDAVTLKHTASGGDYGSVVLDVVVTVTDDDTVGLVIDPAAVTVAEADDPKTQNISEHQGTYTVKLATEPSADVTVAITGQASTDVSVDAASLTFTVAKWNEAQTVTVTAAEDDDASNDEVTLKHTASGGDYGSVVLDVVVTVTDDDTVGLVVDPAAVTVAEADDPNTPAKEHQGTYTVKLATEPSADVTVAVTGHAGSDLTLDAASLTFTVAKWNDAQTVTVTASQDDDASNDLVTLKHTASGGDYGSVELDVVVTVEDDDTVGLVVDPAAVTIEEADDPATQNISEHQGTYTMRLATEPSADVTVAVTGQADTDVSVDAATLTFTVEKWNEAQTVTVTASQDDDAANDEVTLKHTASGGDYGSVVLDVVVTVSDDDEAGLVAPSTVTVGEGGSQTYTVKLATEPSADVTVAVAGHAGSDLTLDKESLTFTVAKWNEAQTVTVTAAEDDDASNDAVTLKHTASGGDYGSVELDVVVTVSDDDTAGLVVDPAAVTVGEGADATYTVKLATEPSADVTVAVTGQASTDVSVDEATLTFTVAKWNDAQTVTVTAAEDDDASNDEVTLKHTASGGDYGSVELDVGVTVTDDDSPGLVVAPAAVTVGEGADATYTVKLATEPSADVTVAVTGQASTDVSVDEATLTFTVAKWNDAQTVTVTAAEDDDASNDEVTLKHTASGGDYGSVELDVVVTVSDDDTAGLVVDPAAVTVGEGADATYTVKLATEPSADVTVAVTGQASTDVSVDEATLTFTVAKWNDAQTVTVTAAEDDDASNDEVTLKHTASGGDYGSVELDVGVTVTDDDSPGLVVAPAAVTVGEGADATYTVKLATEPSADVTVAVAGHAGSDLTLDTESLTFTVAKWNDAQTVTVTASQDDDASNDAVTLKHTASGGDYGSVVLDVVVTVTDDDTVGLVIDPAAVTVAEADDPKTQNISEHQGTYTVKLATEPSADVTVAITGQASTDVSVDAASLTFTVAKWNEAQTVTVTAAEDDDASNDEVTLKHTASGGDYGSVVLDVVVTVTDDDTVGLVVDPAAVTVAEADDPNTPAKEHQGTYTVKLATEPSADVTVAVTGHAGSDLTLDAASLTFTVAKWNDAQTVTVTASQDDDASNDLVTLKHTASGGDYGSVVLDVVVTVEDDDTVGLVVDPAAVTIEEADDPATQNISEHQGTYTMRLATEPSADVTVAITGQASTDVSVDAATLTFTVAKWNDAQTVTVTASQDDDAANDEVTLKHTASGGDYGSVVLDVVVTVSDDDEAGLVAPSTVTVGEGGSQTYTVKLATEPSADVTVAVAGHAGSDLTLDKESLTFTVAKWNEAQTVTVTAAEDDDASNDAVTLKHTASGGDYGSVELDVVVTVSDDDTAGLVVDPAAVTVGEGADATYTVKLATEPSADVTVAVTGQASTDVSVDEATLTFTVAKWNDAQTVTVTAAEDDDASNDEVTLKHTASGGDYGSVELDVGVTVTDDDSPGLVVAPAAVTVGEGADATYTVKLATEPSADVTVAITGQASTDVSVDTASLTFTVGKWNDAQTVTVTASQDDDASNDLVTLKHTASGGDYGSVELDVVVTVSDDDSPGLVVDPAAVTVAEADDPATQNISEHQGTYTVKLATEPSADVTVAITGQASTDVSVDAATLTFTVAKWNDAQTVTVTASQDDDASNDEVTLKHTASGGDYGSVVLDVGVTVEDDDTVGLVVDPAAVTVAEADDPATQNISEHQGTYTVKLATEPSADVTVAITGQASTDVSVDTASLTFTVAKWNDAQTVTVTAAEDDDASNDEVTLKHTASGGDYGSVVLDVVVTVEDDDTVGLVVDPAAVTIGEADDPETPAKEHQGTYTVKLATEPSADVTVAVTGQASTDVSVDAATLTFTVAKWNDAQTVTVTASQDDDASNDEVTLKHTASGGDYGSVVLDVVVTVEDDDTVGLVVDPAAVTVAEADDPNTPAKEHQGTYTVTLATEPSADVTVAITGQASTDVSVDAATLTFTVAKWNDAQTVTVTAAEDDDASNDEVTLKHTASGGDYGSVVLDVVVTVEDDDTVGLVVDPAAVTVAEADDPNTPAKEHQGTYTVRLATEPSADVTVAVAGQASTDVSVDAATLTFTVAKWNDAQTVTVTASQDDDASNDLVTLKHTASGGDYGSVVLDVVVTVEDDDTAGLVVDPAAVTVGEGADATYTVKLATEPSADVTVAVTGQASTDVSVDTASLTFTVAKWNDAQTVTVTASQDDDASNDEVTLKHTASGGDYGSVELDVGVTVTDDDSPGLVVAPAAVTVGEGADATYTVKLATEPSADVTVAVAGHAGSDLTLDTESLTFTVGKWNDAQTVTVTASQDDDASNDLVTLKHTASGGDYGSVELDVVVTVSDDDSPGLVVDPAAVTVAEADDPATQNISEHQGTYTVKLATEPSADVTVTVTGQASTDVSVDAATLTFTVAKWNDAQTVTVTAAEDDDASNDEVTLKHTASGGDYGSVVLDVVVTVEDDDTVGLVVDPAAVTIGEADDPETPAKEHQGTYTVKLATEPSADVTVAVTGQASTDVSVDAATLTFTVAKWNDAQTVTVTASQDDDASNDLVTLKHTASGGDYGSVELDVVVTVEDDDTVGLVVDPAAVTIGEADDPETPAKEHQGTYTVTLATEPSADVTVAITGQASTDVSVDAATLTFTVAKWNDAQTVTVTAAEDDDASNDEVTLKHTASGGDYGSVVLDVVVTVEDDDTVGLVVDPAAVTVAEADDPNTPAKEHQGTYTVRLATEPSADVTVAVAGQASTDVSVDAATLTFTVAKWNDAQTVTVTASQDDDASNDLVTLKHTASGGDYGSVVLDVVVTVEDDDTAGLVVDPAAVTVGEGADATYTVKLATEPSADVTVAVTGQASTDVSVDTASLTFTVAKWNDAQTVTVTAAEDDDASNDEVTLKHTASGGDYGSVELDVGVTVTDDDSPGLVVAPAAVTVGEGADATYTVKLATEPSADVTVAITGQASTDVSVDTASLTFTVGKWNDAQTVTVTASQDDDASNDLVTLKHTASGGDYGSVVLDVGVTVEDDDTVGLVVDPAAVTIGEADDPETPAKEHQGTYTVTLATEPSADVTVAITGQASTDVSVDAATLTFTVAKWNDAQTVTVTAAEDDDASNDEVTLKHTASGGDYGSVVLDVGVTVEDDDTVGLVAPAAVTVGEGADATYTVKLATEPSADVTVAVTGQASTDVSVDTASLTFTVAKWNDAQTVTVTAAEDDDASNDEVTLKHTASGGDYGSVTADVVVTVEDDDETPTGITLSAVPESVTENGGAQTIAVTATVTGGRYTEAKTVTVSVSDGTAESPADYAAVADFDITIGAGAGSASGSFTLTPVDDAVDEGDETIAVTGDSGALTITPETITITDDDEAPTGITLRAVPESVTENGGAQTIAVTATVNGAARYASAQTVTVSVSDGTAESPADYAAVADFDITIGAGAASATGSFTLTPVDDAVDEQAETIAVTGDSGALTITSDTITITDNDTVGLVVRPSAVTVGEGASQTYTVALATEPSATVTVTIGGTSGTDLSVDDASLEFTASAWGTAQTVTVSAGEDADAANDTATLTHAASGGGYGSVTANVAVTVIDDDEVSTAVSLSLDPTEVSEGAEPTGVTVTAALNAATLPTDVVLEVTVAAGTANAEDFAAVAPFALTIGAGATSGTAAFTFTPVDDAFDEPDETVTVSGRITVPPESTLTVAPAVLTILDDDETPTISVADASAVESAGEIVFPVTLSGASSRTITVSYRTADGTAEAGDDYEAGDGELSFAPGETARSVTIAVIDDALDEADETFLVQLGEAENATVADGEATGTITDEDQTPLITIADASVVESSGEIGFLVTLDGPSGRPISVVCRSADGTAIAGEDYTEEVGVLRFEPGETQKTISMEVLDDAVDEDTEQFLLNLSEPVNVRLAAEVVSAVGTIQDDDAAVTVAWLARFGRTVTQQVLEAVGERTQGGPPLGSQVSLAGHRVSADALVVGGDEEGTESDVLSGRSGDYRILSGQEFLAASSFLVAMDPGAVDQAGGVTEEADEGVRWTVWGRGAASGFEGLDEDGRLSIDGSVLTGLAGVDADLGGWLGGLAVGRSDGNGGYGWAGDADRPAREGDLEAELTSVYPYVRVPVADWLSVWGVFGYGVGELRQVEEVRLEEQTAIGMLLGAFGGRGELLTAEAGGGLELAVKADGYLLRMTSESTPVLPTVEADVMRLRLTAEGSGQVRIGSGLVVRPSVEVGVRHDGGDVENGTGVELGGGLSLTDLGVGLALTGSARVLVTHEDRGYREWGAAGSLSFDPGAPGRGLAVKVDSSYGAAAAGGVEQLWSQGSADLAGAASPVGRVGAEVGYGVAENDWSVRPYAGVEFAGDAPEWRVGTRFGLGAQDVTVEGSGTTDSAAVADSSLSIEYSLRW